MVFRWMLGAGCSWGRWMQVLAMHPDLPECLVVGISSRALFDLERENRVFEEQGVEEYIRTQRESENVILKPGAAFYMIEGLLKVNTLVSDRRLVEVVVMSRNSPDTGLRVFNSIEHYGLDITRAAFTGGAGLFGYLEAFGVDLYLSKNEADVQGAIDSGIAAAVLYEPPDDYEPVRGQVRIAFDGDAVLFSEESEKIYREQGLKAFVEHESRHRQSPLPEGPFAKLLKILSFLQKNWPVQENPFRLALVTARDSPAHSRVVYTLRDWGVYLNEAFFLGGLAKDTVLKSFRAHIFFDDQEKHLDSASKVVPSGKVLYKTGSTLREPKKNSSGD